MYTIYSNAKGEHAVELPGMDSLEARKAEFLLDIGLPVDSQ
jgi:hypothetical protein